MDQQEILVHVTAPSRLSDDKRYQSLADELARFETAAVTHVHGFVGLATTRTSSSRSDQNHLSFYSTTVSAPCMLPRPSRPEKLATGVQTDVSATSGLEHEAGTRGAASKLSTDWIDATNGPFTTGVLESRIQEPFLDERQRAGWLAAAEPAQARLRPRRLGQWQVVKCEPFQETTCVQWMSNNPPYQNPVQGVGPSAGARHRVNTPNPVRPKTAPVGHAGSIQVPRTLNASHKRPASDSFLDCSFVSATPDSQLHRSPTAENVKCLDFQDEARMLRAISEPANTSSTIDSPLRAQSAKRRRLEVFQDDDLAMEDTANSYIASNDFVPSTFDRQHVVRRPLDLEGPYFLCDRSEDWTSPPEPSGEDSSSNHVSSTLSPSQPLAVRSSQTRIVSASAPLPLPIDLISCAPPVLRTVEPGTGQRQPSSPSWHGRSSPPRMPSESMASPPHSATQNFYCSKGSVGRSPVDREPCSSSASKTSSGRRGFTSSIRSLPNQIQAPPPPVGDRPFTTHVSRALSTMVARLPLTQHFRPVCVSRDVQVLERGHWSIRVKIASDEDVVEARRPFHQGELLAALNRQMLGVNSTEKDTRYEAWKAAGNEPSELGLTKRCDLWTQAEFMSFWEVLTKYIQDGKAGHGLSVAKDWAEETVTPRRSTQSTYARIRVYTWGEVVGHMWIMLWVLSDKKTAYIPMEWTASDDAVIVKMSGNRHKGGKLGPWVPKGSTDGKGAWGIEAGTSPGKQAEYARLPSS